VNSVSETRWEMLDLLSVQPFEVVLMAAERVDDGVRRQNTTAEQIATVARRMARAVIDEHGLTPEDIYIDASISALSSDTEGHVEMAIDAIRMINEDPELAGVHQIGDLPTSASSCRRREPTARTQRCSSNGVPHPYPAIWARYRDLLAEQRHSLMSPKTRPSSCSKRSSRRAASTPSDSFDALSVAMDTTLGTAHPQRVGSSRALARRGAAS